jgi:ribonuclease D
MDGGCPPLALVLEYEEVADARPSGRAQQSERDFRRELPTPARPAYDRLRDWRSLRARQDGVPVYVVFNNRELAAIAGTMPANNEALRSIEGIGKGKANLVAAAGRAARGKCGSPEVDDLHDSCGGIVTTGPGRSIPVGSPGRGV